MAITYTNVPGMNPSSIDFRLGTVQIARGTTNEQQEIICLGDPQSSLAIGQVLASEPPSTTFGVVVRPVNYSQTTAIAAGTTAVTAVKGSSGRLLNILVTSSGSAIIKFHDHATTSNGTVIGYLAANLNPGSIITFNMPAANGIVYSADGSSNGPAVTVAWS